MWRLHYSKQAVRFLKKCPDAQRINNRIRHLADQPVPHNAVRVMGEARTFRIRIGTYRVLYEINWTDKVLLVAKIDKRSRAYE